MLSEDCGWVGGAVFLPVASVSGTQVSLQAAWVCPISLKGLFPVYENTLRILSTPTMRLPVCKQIQISLTEAKWRNQFRRVSRKKKGEQWELGIDKFPSPELLS